MRLPSESRAAGEVRGEVEALRGELQRVLASGASDHDLLHAILDRSPHALVACDAGGRLIAFSRAAERIWGGQPPADWAVARWLLAPHPSGAEELEIERFDHRRAVVLAAATPILDRSGEVSGAVGLFVDVAPFRERERELLERERRAATRLGRLQALTAALSESVSPEDVARAALEHGLAALGARDAGLWVVADGRAELLHAVGFGARARARFGALPLEAPTPLSECIRDGDPIWLGSRAELEARYPRLLAVDAPVGAATCLPLQVKGLSLGALSFTFAGEHDFSGEDRAYLLAAARNVAQALDRARLFEAEQRARAEAVAVGERSAFLSEASALLASSLEYQTTLTRVAQLAVPRVADWCTVDLAEDLASRRGAVVVAHQDPSLVSLARRLYRRYPADPDAEEGAPAVLRTGRPELYHEIPGAPLPGKGQQHLRLARALGIRSALLVPMIARGRTLGVITLACAQSERRYRPADLEMAQHLARRAALAIDNARLYEQAQEAVRAREEAVAVVSHDLKNPLNAILMSAGLLRRSAAEPDHVRHHAETIERAVTRMRELVRDLLDLARLEAGRLTLDRQPHAASALVADALGMLQPLAQAKAITLEADTGPAAAERVRCDRARVLQVLSNLVGNAIAFTPQGGRVTVRCRRSGDELVLAVVDSGPGIPPEEQRLVFERFWKARATGQGTGLGLSIAKAMVEAHGGRIWVESRRGDGAAFLFTLPREG